MLLGCLCFPRFFSVDAFAAGSAQTVVPFSDGTVKVFWHSSYNGNGVSYGSFDGTDAHTVTIDSWSSDKNSGGELKGPKLDSIKFSFNQSFSMQARSDYYLFLYSLGVSFDKNTGPVSCSFYDEYNSLVWTDTYFAPGTNYEQNGCLYYVIRDLPIGLNVKYIQYTFNFNDNFQYPDGTFGSGFSGNTWMKMFQLESGSDADDVIGAIEDQTASEQNRYDDFTQGGDDSELNSATDQVSGKIGIFTALDNLLQGIFGIFTSGTADAATIVWPSFSLTVEGQSYDVWPEQTINLDTMFSGSLSALKVALNFGSVSAVYFALVRYLLHVYEAIFGRGDS